MISFKHCNNLRIRNHKSTTPIQYQKGWVEFYKLRFKVTPDVLIPRPETELLVDEVLRFVSHLSTANYQLPTTVLDIGTGSGNIAISIAKNTPNVKIVAADISRKALTVARQNAKLHKADKITFIKSDLLSNISSDSFDSLIPDIIVTNLPYIPSARIPYLDSSVRDFEPKIALDGGKDGFELYRKLFTQIKQKKWRPKLIVGEIDYTHRELAALEAQKYFPDAQIEVRNDLAKKQRILLIRRF